MTDHASTLERLETGSAALDMILGGGIPAGSVTVVAFDAHLVKPASDENLTRVLGRGRWGD